MNRKIEREKETIVKMIEIYCFDNHQKKKLCADCYELSKYANTRIEKCQFGEFKPICRDCPVHCYQTSFRDKIREVMRYSGPRLIYKYPLLAFLHSIDQMKGKKTSSITDIISH